MDHQYWKVKTLNLRLKFQTLSPMSSMWDYLSVILEKRLKEEVLKLK